MSAWIEKAKTKQKLYHLVSTALLIIFLLMINLAVQRLPPSLTRLDLTAQGIYTLSEQSKMILSALNVPVEICLLAQSGQEDAALLELLEKYQEASTFIHTEVIDPVKQPAFLSARNLQINSGNSLLISSERRARIIDYYEIYDAREALSGQVSGGMSFSGESKITGAVQYVTAENTPVFYWLSDVGSEPLIASLKASIENHNIELQSLKAANLKALPEDTAGLLFYGPSEDLSEEEKEGLSDYLQQGGSLFLLTDPRREALPSLVQVLADYGVAPAPGLVMEGDPNSRLPDYPYYLIPVITGHEITYPLIQEEKFVLAPLAQPIGQIQTRRQGIEQSPLLSSSGLAWLDQSLSGVWNDAEEAAGPYIIAAAISESLIVGETRIVWVTSTALFDETVDQLSGGANTELVLNTLDWLSGREIQPVIPAKDMGSAGLVLTDAQASRWSLVFVAVLPGLTLAVGCAVWFRRRRK